LSPRQFTGISIPFHYVHARPPAGGLHGTGRRARTWREASTPGHPPISRLEVNRGHTVHQARCLHCTLLPQPRPTLDVNKAASTPGWLGGIELHAGVHDSACLDSLKWSKVSGRPCAGGSFHSSTSPLRTARNVFSIFIWTILYTALGF
jgi:hypothetical protein